jgi:hypothetical protein
LLAALLIGGGCPETSRSQRASTWTVPESAHFLSCDQSGAWISSRRAVGARPVIDGQLQPAPRVTDLHRFRPGEQGRMQEVGGDVARTLSAGPDGAIWLSMQLPSDDLGGEGRLLVGQGLDGPWREWPAPGAMIGSAPEGSGQGFAWSRHAISWTSTAGRAWLATETGDLLVAGPGLPRLIPEASGGGLLVPLVSAPEAQGRSELWWIGRDLSKTPLARWEGERITGVAILGGDVVVSTEAWLHGASRVLIARLERRPLEFTEAWRSETERTQDLQASGALVAFLAAGPWGQGRLSGETAKVLYQSADGRSWTRHSLATRYVRSFCLSPRGRWLLSEVPSQLSYTPSP